jgi:hypothetical protein
MCLVHHGRLNSIDATKYWNMCNMLLQHSGRNIVLLVLTFVALVIFCNQGVEWLITSYNTLITIRVTSGAMFMLTKMTKMPSNVLLTNPWPWNALVWPVKKSSLEILHGEANLRKVVENFLRNKSSNMAISWKWPEHAQKWPTSRLKDCPTLGNFLSLQIWNSVSMCPTLTPYNSQSRLNQSLSQLTKL